MNRPRMIALVAAILFAAVLSLRLWRSAPSPPPSTMEIPLLSSMDVDRPAPSRVSPPTPEPPSPSRLAPFLEQLGRAKLLRDRRTLDVLRRNLPAIYESDTGWIISKLEADLFMAAGAAELVRWFAFHDATPALASVLARPGHAFLKDVVIETLASLGTDAAESAILNALGTDPDDSIRIRCAAALPAFRGPGAYQALVEALRDPSPRVRSAASTALARMGSKEAVGAFLAALQIERDPGLQADFIAAIWTIGGEPVRATLLQAVEDRPEAAAILRSRSRLRDKARYGRVYDRSFFEPGGSPVAFDPSKRRIGITLDLGAGATLPEVALALFGASPLDRYRAWFYFRKADDFPEPRAYDSTGNRMEDLPYNDLDGTVYLHFRDSKSFSQGVLGYTKGCNAFVQGVSLLHEFGHAFARLGDEYADGSRDAAENLAREPEIPWTPMVEARLLDPPVKRDAEFSVPSKNCYLNNSATQSRYCPVCQLEILARISELSGIPLPW